MTSAAPATAVPATSDRIRVLWLIKTLSVGGAERLLVSLAEVVDQRYFSYEVAAVQPSEDYTADFRRCGIPVHFLGTENHFDLRWVRRLRRLLVEKRFDILHMHLPYVAGIGRLVADSLPRNARPRLITTQHCVWKATPILTRALDYITLPLDDLTLAVSKDVRDSMPGCARDRVEAVVHGIILDQTRALRGERSSVRAELGIATDEVLVMSVAALRFQKGHDLLLQAASELVSAGLPVRFAFVGEGPLADELQSLCHRLRLDAHVTFLGLRVDALRLLAGADVFVMPSRFEGYPVAVMEALALGVPVVATAVGGVPEAVRDGVEGLVVPPERADLLAGTLRRLVLDTDLRTSMSRLARLRGKRFDIRGPARHIESRYLELLSAGTRRGLLPDRLHGS
jgi:glycosyltransferase involved in cell wall biosynthesis